MVSSIAIQTLIILPISMSGELRPIATAFWLFQDRIR